MLFVRHQNLPTTSVKHWIKRIKETFKYFETQKLSEINKSFKVTKSSIDIQQLQCCATTAATRINAKIRCRPNVTFEYSR